jgi:hypothetical protein
VITTHNVLWSSTWSLTQAPDPNGTVGVYSEGVHRARRDGAHVTQHRYALQVQAAERVA